MARPREFDEDQVLDAVMETFWQRGYAATTAQDLVDATGLGRGSLYAAFTNKDGLFQSALRRYLDQSRAMVARLEEPGPVLDRLRALLIDVVGSDADRPDRRGCLVTNSAIESAGRDQRIADLVRQNFDIVIAGIRTAIVRGQISGEFSSDRDADVLALYVFAAMQGLRVLAATPPCVEYDRLMLVVDQTLDRLR